MGQRPKKTASRKRHFVHSRC